MDTHRINTYAVNTTYQPEELKQIMTKGALAILESIESLTSNTEVDPIRTIQGSLILIGAAIQSLAPELDDVGYDHAMHKTVEAWALLRGGIPNEQNYN